MHNIFVQKKKGILSIEPPFFLETTEPATLPLNFLSLGTENKKEKKKTCMLYSKWWIFFLFFVHTGRNESFSSVKFIRGKVLRFILPVFLCHTLVYTAAILIEERFTPVAGVDQTKNSVSLLPLSTWMAQIEMKTVYWR